MSVVNHGSLVTIMILCTLTALAILFYGSMAYFNPLFVLFLVVIPADTKEQSIEQWNYLFPFHCIHCDT